MDKSISHIPNIYQNLPSKPGVYLFKDVNDKILYIGKAVNLKSRVSSYFSSKHIDRPWIKVMMGLVNDVETIEVTNEIEALMLEATLIKQHLPHFNIKLTDDKTYPYIKLSEDPWPRFSVVRRQHGDKATYFGPYLSARSAYQTLEFLRDLYGIHISPKPLKRRERSCFNCQLKNHLCVLAGETTIEEYNERVKQATDFLLGKRKNLINDVTDRMAVAAQNEQYELAAKLRDQLQAMQQVTTRQQVVSTTMDDYDVIGVNQAVNIASVALLHVREGRVSGQHHFFFDLTGDETRADVVRQFLVSVYKNFTFIPPLVVLPEAIEDQDLIEQWLKDLASRTVELRIAQRGDKRELQELANRNAQSKLETRLLRKDQSFTGVVALQELLQLGELPQRIEAVDISNLGTSEPVGAIVCFINGQAAKDEYRRYKIKTVEGQNDFAMIREVVARRFFDTDRPAPDVFVVDGGPEQLKFALEALESSPVKPKHIISLAKKPDRIFLPNRKSPLPAPKNNKGLLLLSRIRDEVHRFGLSFQRQRQRKKSLGKDT